jgi:hypothetical protein
VAEQSVEAFSQVRRDITEALENERNRLARSKARHTIETSERIMTLDTMLGILKTQGQVCFLELRRELKPWEIRL